MLPGHIERLSWTRENVRDHQTDSLRRLLRAAKDNTKFYGDVLAGVDVDNFRLEDIQELPPHDKIAHMERWDDFIAAPGITYEIAEWYIDAIRSGAESNPFYK